MDNSTTRFGDRVEDYVKYRPHYPQEVLPYLREKYVFDPSWEVADIGSGTGISTELFLCHQNRVFAVEPNTEMRGKAEELLGSDPHFVSINGTAEATGLPAGSVRLVVAGQAFHWFDPVKSRAEFVRILSPGGVVVLIWNDRLADTEFEKAYDALIESHAKDYKTSNHRNLVDLQIEAFYRPASCALKHFPNEQLFDFEGLKGRLLSSSYMPKTGPGYASMLEDLRRLFDRYQHDGRVRVGYSTNVYSGILKP
jgi:SAM-dependent methyltransferase